MRSGSRFRGLLIILSFAGTLIFSPAFAGAADGTREALTSKAETAAPTSDAQPLAAVEAGGNLITFKPLISHSQVRVTVTGPDGFQAIQTFNADEIPRIELPGLDGFYKYELRFAPVFDDRTRAALATARVDGTEPFENREASATATVQSGAFTIANGSVVPDLVEASLKTVLTNADGVIRNSLCVGFDCPDAPTFGDSSILVMENNTRIKLSDTSAAPFPNNDWEIEANSSLSGGANYLGFNDCGTADDDGDCAADLVFAVEAGARQNALYVESDGDIGIGTSSPVVDIHVVTGNTPTLRLDQDGSSGFSPQVWDIAGNETNFFIRDVTSGSRLPFRIRPGAPTSSIDIAADGDVGLGTTSPADGARLHVLADTGGVGAVDSIMLENNGPSRIRLKNTAIANSATDDQQWVLNSNGTFRLSAGNDAAEMILDAAGNLTILGSLTEGSDFNAKENIEGVDPLEVLAKVVSLDVTRWNFKGSEGSQHIGPMAQDFYRSFGLGADATRISPRDVASVALVAIQAMHADLVALRGDLAQKDERIESLQTQILELQKRLAD